MQTVKVLHASTSFHNCLVILVLLSFVFIKNLSLFAATFRLTTKLHTVQWKGICPFKINIYFSLMLKFV